MLPQLPYLPWPQSEVREVRSSGRELAAAALHRASALLARLAASLAGAAAAQGPSREPVLEFYAEAGAPEGALYIDGQLVGTLAGVTRL